MTTKVKCGKPATYRVFWPGREPLAQCKQHHEAVLGVARAMGFHCHSELSDGDEVCSQMVAKPEESE